MNELIKSWGIKKVTMVGLSVLALVLLIPLVEGVWEEVDAREIVVIQGFIDGKLHVYTQPGPVLQNFGRVTKYRKSFTYGFDKEVSGKDVTDKTIKIRFNDGGHAQIGGSVRIDLPLDEVSMIQIHSLFGSQEAIENMLITPIITKSIYMTGPLLSSKESSAEKRNYLLSYVEDQAAEGVYKTELKNDTVVDVTTKEKKLVQHVNIIEIKKVVQRQEESLFKKFHVHISNLSLNSIDYDEGVEAQIKVQQQASMAVQTAMANSKKAEQDAITVEMQGKANAAKAKWEQEVIKSTQVTKAEQEKEVAITNAEREKEVARLASVQAGFYKTQQILEGQGDAEKKRLSTASNNNLEYKVDAWVKVNVAYAEAMKSSSWVPTTVIGGGGSGAPGMGDAGQALINMLMVKTAKDLNIPATPTK